MRICVPINSDSSPNSNNSTPVSNDFSTRADIQMGDPMGGLELGQKQNTIDAERLERLERFELALSKLSPKMQAYLSEIIEGQDPEPPHLSTSGASNNSIPTDSSKQIMKTDVRFEKWDGEPLLGLPTTIS